MVGLLLEGWVEKAHKGRRYYMNATTRQKSWMRPEAGAAVASVGNGERGSQLGLGRVWLPGPARLVTTAMALHLASPDEMGGRHARLRGLSTHSMKALAKGSKAFENGKMLATVIYWVARAAINPEGEGEASRLPDGDARVLGEIYEG